MTNNLGKKYSYKKLYVVANLPYYITTPIIEKIIDDKLGVDKIVIMVQKEVGDRFNAKVGSKEYEPFSEDFCTVNPYLGSDGIDPFIDVCKEEKKGIFVLVKTSNPSSGEFQDRPLADANNRPLYEIVGEKVAEWGADCMGDSYSYVGAVVGATYPEMGKVLREIMPKSLILVPGYGAQGGKGADLVHFFNADGLGAIVNSSRGIIAAYQNEKYKERFTEADFAAAAREAVLDMQKDIGTALGTL